MESQVQNSFKEELVFPNIDVVQSDRVKPQFMLHRILFLIYFFLLFKIVLKFLL